MSRGKYTVPCPYTDLRTRCLPVYATRTADDATVSVDIAAQAIVHVARLLEDCERAATPVVATIGAALGEVFDDASGVGTARAKLVADTGCG